MAYFILTETELASQLKADSPNGNIIYREDYQKSFKKEVRYNDAEKFLRKYPILIRDCPLMREGIGEFYPSYTNSEKERFVCRPSRTQGIHDGYDPKMQAVKLADVFGIEKIWASVYECNRQHGDFDTKRSTILPWA